MTKKEFRAYNKGHDAAIFKSNENPFTKKQSRLSAAWTEGYNKGKAAVTFHTSSLRSSRGSSSASWVDGLDTY